VRSLVGVLRAGYPRQLDVHSNCGEKDGSLGAMADGPQSSTEGSGRSGGARNLKRRLEARRLRPATLSTFLREYRAPIVLGALGGAAFLAAGWFLLVSLAPPSQSLRLAAGSEGGVYLPVAEALADAFETHVRGLTIEVVPTAGSNANASMLESGEVDLALLQNDARGSSKVRTVAPLYQEYLHLVARADLSVRRPSDLSGKRIALGAPGSGTRRLAESFLPAVGLPKGSYRPTDHDPASAVPALSDEGSASVDAFVAVLGLPSETVREAIREHDAVLVELARAGVEGNIIAGYQFGHPWAEVGVIPRGTYGAGNGGVEPPRPVGTVAVLSVLAGRHDLDPSLVESLVEAMYEHRPELVRKQPRLASLREGFDRSRLQFPLHAGARRWFNREKPPFLVAYAETMGFLLSAGLALLALFSGVARWFAQRQKNRIDEHYKKLHRVLDELEQLEVSAGVGTRVSVDLSSEQDGLTAEQRLAELEKATKEIGRTAFRELVDEQLAANESFVIFQNLLSETQDEIRRRLDELPAT
jgi:TRAP transporter TAXI family solute receptor